MFIAAHIFLGVLIGFGLWCLTDDRRILPLSIFGAVLPDLLDKSLALLMPGIFGSGRTLGHTLIFFLLLVTSGILFWRYRHTLLGIALAFGVLSHQVLDAMWMLPSAWYFPFLGPFPVRVIEDYVWHYFLLEISTPSEWIFGMGALVFIAGWFVPAQDRQGTILTQRSLVTARFLAAFLLGFMGLHLLVSGLATASGAFFAPTYDPVTAVMAGCCALSGALVLVKMALERSVFLRRITFVHRRSE